MDYFTVHTDAVTGEVTHIPWTAEEIAAREAKFAAMQPPPVVPTSITRRQCALQLLAMQYITPTEALAMTKSAEVPAAVAAIFDQAVTDGTMTAEQRILAEIDFAAANYYRSNSLLSLMGLTEEQIDQFFIAAAQL